MTVVLYDNASTAPPPPGVLPPEQRRERVQVFAWGTVKHPNGDFVVDREFWAQMKASFEASTHKPPVLKQHSEDGYTYGKVVGLTADEAGIWADVELSQPAYEAYQLGMISNWSPGLVLKTEDHHTGEERRNVLRELSFVSVPHLKNTNTKSPVYSMADGSTLEEGEMKEETKMQEGGLEEVWAVVGDLQAKIGEIADLLKERAAEKIEEEIEKEIEGDMADIDPPAEDADMEDDKEYSMSAVYEKRLKQMEAKLKAQEDRATRAEASEKLKGLEMGDAERDVLLQLACDHPKAFAANLKVLKSQVTRMAEAAPKGADSYTAFLNEGGSVGSVQAGGTGRAKIKEAVTKMAAAKTGRWDAFSTVIKEQRINMADEGAISTLTSVLDEVYGAK